MEEEERPRRCQEEGEKDEEENILVARRNESEKVELDHSARRLRYSINDIRTQNTTTLDDKI